MGAFFERFNATRGDGQPPEGVTLSAGLRTHAQPESVVLRYRLDDDNDVWFQDAPENPGRAKEILFDRTVDPGGTDVTVTASLSYGPGEQRPSAVVQGAVLPSRDGEPMHEADDEIFIR